MDSNYYHSAETIAQARAAAQANDTTAYEVYIKKHTRGKTVGIILFGKVPADIKPTIRKMCDDLGPKASCVGYVGL